MVHNDIILKCLQKKFFFPFNLSEILKGFAHVLVLSDYYLAAKLPRKKSVCQFKPSVMCSLSINRSLCVSSPHLMVISLIQQSLRGQREGRRKYSPERCGFLHALTLRLLTLPTHKSSLSPPIFQTCPQPITCLLSSPPLLSQLPDTPCVLARPSEPLVLPQSFSSCSRPTELGMNRVRRFLLEFSAVCVVAFHQQCLLTPSNYSSILRVFS